MARPHSRKLCRHCNARHINRPLGLCWTCYYMPAVRQLYPSESIYTRHYDEPTEEELDAIIAEQRESLPAWWDKADDQRPAGESRTECEEARQPRRDPYCVQEAPREVSAMNEEDIAPGVYIYQSGIPAGCKGHEYRLHRFVIDVPSKQRKVLVECLTGPDAGLWFVCSVSNFCRRYAPPAAKEPEPVQVEQAFAEKVAGRTAEAWGRS